MTEQTIEQLQERDEFAINLARKANVRLTRDLMQTRAELAQERERADLLNMVLTDANELHAEVRAELTQAHEELAAVDRALGEFYCPVLNPETGEECGAYFQDHGVMDMSCALQRQQDDAEELRQQLAQARAELKDLHETDHEFGRLAIRRNRDYWYDKAVAAECECDEWRKKAQAQSDEVQELWLSPVEAEELRRQLKKTEAQTAAAREAVEWLWGFWDGNTLRAIPGSEEDIGKAWNKLLAASGAFSKPWEHHGKAAAKLLKRLATLDVAEAALADARRVAQLWFRRAQEAELAAHAHGKAADELAQTVHTERALRREAERHYETALMAAHSRGERLEEAEQRAEETEQERDHWRSVTKHKRAWRREAQNETVMEGITYRTNLDETAARLAIAKQRLARRDIEYNAASSAALNLEERLTGAEQHAERAEALAALVTIELAQLLEDGMWEYDDMAGKARALAASLAARIREALALEANDEKAR